jgi:hypothetical protein
MMKNAEKRRFFVEAKKAWGERTSLLILMGILFVVDMNMRMRTENWERNRVERKVGQGEKVEGR